MPIAPNALSRHDSDFEGFAAGLGAAFERYGFAVIEGHGLPPDLLAAADADARAFFALPEQVKRRYLVPPEFQFQAELHARATGQEVLGYYHSHPDHPAQPSEYDRVHAWPGYLYLICAVSQGRATDLNAFTLEGEGGAFLAVAVPPSGPDPQGDHPCPYAGPESSSTSNASAT